MDLWSRSHCAVLVLQRSPLRNEFDLDEILELVEVKKSSFWNKLFKPGSDKKNLKKKGQLLCLNIVSRSTHRCYI